MDPNSTWFSVMNIVLFYTERDGITFKIALQGNTARMRLTELSPTKQRYEPPIGDVLVDEPKQDR